MNEDMLGLIVLAVFGLFIVGSFLYVRWKRAKREKSYPKTWVSVGEPVKNLEIALQVIREEMPDWRWRWGGTIEWVDGPFIVSGVSLDGGVENEDEPRIKLRRFSNIYQTALAHEIRHIWWIRSGKDGNGEGENEFYAWIFETNRKIAERINNAAVG